MRNYAVHLICHLLVLLAGLAGGIATGLWWFEGNVAAGWLALLALVVALGVLALQTSYLRRERAPSRPRGSRDSRARRTLPEPGTR
ncbi:hypothetical protein SAMN04487820_107108 [Actinopolyspora mzabensis]|uniref:Uncharacterized protein n=1 Tax=Actinopolyspora mzabensis TaxID=995066 RepID=A0A1G9BEC2_ACTMZ|nr:hypothetical protein [Actinopolyspora mzabensis]SDK37839.1 hypothetical protein SAMN04487820_107108 [Actinopolyspora mzabensis]